MEKHPENTDVIKAEYSNIMRQGFETIASIYFNIKEFLQYVDSNREDIENKVSNIMAAMESNEEITVLGPYRKIYSIISFKPAVHKASIIYYLVMDPPVVPHFFLTLSYLYLSKGFVPAAVVRTHPVVKLASILYIPLPDEDPHRMVLTATVAQARAAVELIDKIVTGEASLLPLEPYLLELPLEGSDGKIYVTEYGLSPVQIAVSGFNEDASIDLPPLDDEKIASEKFTSLKTLIDGISF